MPAKPLQHALCVGDRVCFEGATTKFGHVDGLREFAVHVLWDDDSPATWLPRQRVYYAPDGAEVERQAGAMKPWREG
jgi:hypothetical protein